MNVAEGDRRAYSAAWMFQGVREGLELLARPAAEAGSSPTACLGSPEPRREIGDGTDGRDPPVSDRVWEREPARDAWDAWAGLGRG